jgi:trimethylamine--corrinoid protein Co-methyltransferase
MGFRNYLKPEDTKQLANAALEVLANTGLRVNNDEAVDLLMSNGANAEDGRILLPKRMVNEALDKAQSTFRLFGRKGRSIRLGTDATYFGPGSDALYQVDQDTGSIRLSTLQDVAQNVRIADALDGFDFMMSMALPSGIVDHLYAKVFVEMAKNTSKPMVVTMTTVQDLMEIHDMASIIAGGKERLRAKPTFLAYLEPRSPLIYDDSSMQRLLYAAEHEIPYTYASGANCGITAPITLQGAVVQGTAECLGGLVVGTLKNSDARFVFGSNSAGADLRRAWVSYGNPAWHITTAMYASLADHFNLPSWGTGGATDSVRVDAHSGAESQEGIAMATMYGTSLVHDAGFYNFGYCYDAKYLILVDALIKRARYHGRSLSFSDWELCIDEIDTVARQSAELPGYLASDFTAQHFRESMYIPPEIWDVERIDLAVSPPLGDRLALQRNRILAEHQVEPIEAEACQKLDEYCEGW